MDDINTKAQQTDAGRSSCLVTELYNSKHNWIHLQFIVLKLELALSTLALRLSHTFSTLIFLVASVWVQST